MNVELQELGVAIGQGIVNRLATYVLVLLVVNLLVKLAGAQFGWWTDDSDKSGHYRSGMYIKTDYKTGVQYLSDGKGGLIVRADANGKPITYQGAGK